MEDWLTKHINEMMVVLSIQFQQSRADDPSQHASSSKNRLGKGLNRIESSTTFPKVAKLDFPWYDGSEDPASWVCRVEQFLRKRKNNSCLWRMKTRSRNLKYLKKYVSRTKRCFFLRKRNCAFKKERFGWKKRKRKNNSCLWTQVFWMKMGKNIFANVKINTWKSKRIFLWAKISLF